MSESKPSKKAAFRLVYDELKKCSLLMGKYDAEHGNDHFMYGICTVMEKIAFNAGKEDEFYTKFCSNMRESEIKANGERHKESKEVYL